MIFSEILFTSLSSLKSNPVRSFLTALAIIIGIGSVIAMLSIGSGAQKLLVAHGLKNHLTAHIFLSSKFAMKFSVLKGVAVIV